MDAGRKTELRFVTAEGQISLHWNIAAVLQSPRCYVVVAALPPQLLLTILNTRLSTGEYTLCMSASWPVSAVHYMSAESKPANTYTTVWTGPLMQSKAKRFFEVLLICFFTCLFQKNQKYCSFKYCALHRIFCHKLVNIYIFFSIFRHILSYIQDNKMLLFSSFFSVFLSAFFFWEIPESVCWQLPSFHKIKHYDSLFLCFCDKCVCKISILNVWEVCMNNTAKPEQSAWKMAETKCRPGEVFSFKFWHSFTTMSSWAKDCGERVKLDP